MRLLLSQKNELYKIIEGSEILMPGQFNISEPNSKGDNDVTIILKSTDYYFRIFEDTEYVKSFYVNYVPGIDVFREITSSCGWNDIIQHFNIWIDNVSREIEEPNYWERLEQELSVINITSTSNNSKFTIREYEELKSKINLISQNLDSIPLLLEQQNEIRRELERLTEIAKDLGKYDWLNLFIGTIISIVIQLSVTKENVVMLWDLIKTTLKMYFLK